MHVKKMVVLSALALALLPHSKPAAAVEISGNVSGAALACYVDTNAYDQPKVGVCRSIWTPGTASNPSIAYFTVVGLTTGNYSFVWKDLETNGNPGCSGSVCIVPISTDVSGDGLAKLQVTITDLDNNTQKIVSATARYLDGWH